MLSEFPQAIAMQHPNHPDDSILQCDAQCILLWKGKLSLELGQSTEVELDMDKTRHCLQQTVTGSLWDVALERAVTFQSGSNAGHVPCRRERAVLGHIHVLMLYQQHWHHAVCVLKSIPDTFSWPIFCWEQTLVPKHYFPFCLFFWTSVFYFFAVSLSLKLLNPFIPKALNLILLISHLYWDLVQPV